MTMSAPRRVRPRILSSIAAAVAAVAMSLLVAAPSVAASHNAVLLVRGPGSAYNGPDGYAALAVGAGQTVSFPLKVVNTGTSAAQFNVRMVTVNAGQTVNLYAGSTVVTSFAYDPTPGGGYYTHMLAAGGSEALTLKISAPTNAAQKTYTTYVEVLSTDGSYLTEAVVEGQVKAPTYGTTPVDVFARQGSQPYVGGSVSYQSTEAPALNLGSSATFKVKLQNDGTYPVSISALADMGYAPCLSLTVKDGTTDVTSAVRNGTYDTFALAVHQAHTLTVVLKRTGASGCGAYDIVDFRGFNNTLGVAHTVYLYVPFPA